MTTSLSVAESYERGQRYFDAHDYISAAEYFADVVDAVPDDVAARLLLARAYYHSAQLTRAEAALREVIARDPSEAYAYLMLGRVLQRQSRHAEAETPLRLAAAMSDYAE
jgi:predicted Zn-dependent protease